MRICSKCGVGKDESEYYVSDKKTGRLHAHCKTCYKEHRKTFYKQHYAIYGDEYRARARLKKARLRLEYRQNMLIYMADKHCMQCGEADMRVLEFDHLNPALKKFSISRGATMGYGWNAILEEIKKCQILCANCHKKRSSQQFNWYKAF